MRKRNFVLFLVISIAVLSTGVNALPDLTVLDVWADGRTIMYMIRNIGDTNVSGVCSTLYVDGTPTRSNYLYPVGVGETKIGNFSSGTVYNWYCSGTSDTIRVHIDCEDAITESNENNNDWEYPWYCQGVTTTTSSTTSTVSTTTTIPPPPLPDNGTTTTTIPSSPPDNGTTTTITTTTTIANCHTKPLWDWSYCTSSCKCNAGEGDCDTDTECNTVYCAQNVGTKYGQSTDMDVCENRVTTTTIQSGTTTTIIGSTTTTRVSGSSTTTRQTTTTIKSTGKMINISISSCKDALCKQNSRYFILNATIFLEYNSSLKDISLEANLVYPDGTSEEITLPYSAVAAQVGNYTLEVAAVKQGYTTTTKKLQFRVFESEADIPKDKSEWNIIDIAIAASIAAGLIAGYWYWKRRENKKVVKIIKRKNTEKLMRMLRKRK